MLNITYRDIPDSLEYYNNISVDKEVYFDEQKVRNTIELEKAMAETDKSLAVDALQVGSCEGNMYLGDMSKFGGSQISRDMILRYLRDEVGSKDYLLKVYDKKSSSTKFSLNMDQVLIPLLERGVAEEFLDPFILFRKHNKAANDMNKRVVEKFIQTDYANISALQYKWNKALTGRYYTEDENIQNINKLYLDSMRSKNDDYLLVWGDFDQIDLRVAYYTVISESPEDDEIFSSYEDKYEAMARIIDKKLRRRFNIDLFRDNRSKYKRGILARCYGQSLRRLITTVRDKDFSKMLDTYYLENGRYTEWYNSVEQAISENYINIYTYFGNLCRVVFEDGISNEQRLDRVLNCPIQGTSNDIVMHTVNNTVREFRNNGVSEDKFRVYMVRHDEPIYMIHKSIIDMLPIIRKNTILQIDDWGPITMSLDIGTFYSVSEMDKYKKYFGDEDITTGRILSPRDYIYNPMKKQQSKSIADVSVHGRILTIGNSSYELKVNVHKQFQIHALLAKYAIDKKITTVTFNIVSSDVKLYDVFVDGVYMYFNSMESIA